MPRYWLVRSNFHTIGEVVKCVQAPNWQGGLRKAALAIKGDQRLKGRKIKVASFTLQETTGEVAMAHWNTVAAAQDVLAAGQLAAGQPAQNQANEAANEPVVPVLPEAEPER